MRYQINYVESKNLGAFLKELDETGKRLISVCVGKYDVSTMTAIIYNVFFEG